MTIWHGTAGAIKLERTDGGQRVYEQLNPGDVDVGVNRFSFTSSLNSLVTGDQVWLRRIEEDGNLSTSPLDMVAGWTFPDGQWYARVDRVGGITLHLTWEQAINGDSPVPLATPASAYRVSVDVVSDKSRRYLAHVQEYSLQITRDAADSTSVGDGFRHEASTIVGGQGTVNLLWDYENLGCGDPDSLEKAAYLHQLALRQQTGAAFKGYFMLKDAGQQPLDAALSGDDLTAQLFYTFDAVITEVQTTVSVDDVIRSVVSFRTTGPIDLVYEVPSFYLLLDQSLIDRVLRENNEPIALEGVF